MIKKAFTILVAALVLSGCAAKPKYQGALTKTDYYSPQAAYSVNFEGMPFRGKTKKVKVDERCNNSGGSTTLWDEPKRYFRIDHLRIDEHELAKVPRFASDQTALNLVLNGYLHNLLTQSEKIHGTETVHRDFLDIDGRTMLYSIVSLNVDLDLENKSLVQTIIVPKDYSGTYYYGFLLFKRGDLIYVVQHRQPTLLVDTMKNTLLSLYGKITIPGEPLAIITKKPKTTRAKKLIKFLRPFKKPIPLCEA